MFDGKLLLAHIDLAHHDSSHLKNVAFYLTALIYKDHTLVFDVSRETENDNGIIDQIRIYSTDNFEEMCEKWKKIKEDY